MSRDEGGSGPAIVPAHVLHDPEMSPQAKLLAGRIECLTRKEGYCYATNEYLAADLGVPKRTLERWMKQVVESPHYRAEYERTKDGTHRRIHPLRKSGGWGTSDLAPALRKSGDRSKGSSKGSSVARTREGEDSPSRRLDGSPAGPSDLTYSDQRCPKHDDRLRKTGRGLYCSGCDAYYEAAA